MRLSDPVVGSVVGLLVLVITAVVADWIGTRAARSYRYRRHMQDQLADEHMPTQPPLFTEAEGTQPKRTVTGAVVRGTFERGMDIVESTDIDLTSLNELQIAEAALTRSTAAEQVVLTAKGRRSVGTVWAMAAPGANTRKLSVEMGRVLSGMGLDIADMQLVLTTDPEEWSDTMFKLGYRDPGGRRMTDEADRPQPSDDPDKPW